MLVYIAKSPSHRTYVGVTNNFKRRLKEHGSSPYPFGKALRKYGKDSFTYSFIECSDLEEAYEIEGVLIQNDEVLSDWYYNISAGGCPATQLGNLNPMHRPEVVAKHPNIWTSENNPMHDPLIKAKALKSGEKYKKKVLADGVIYSGVREAARALNISRQCLIHRLKSKTFGNYNYL